ncbi:hypothetical protein ACFYUV_42790 [Nonomuraea sp. NPDC003560]|uniref:hypothetical protein n=1 Tax=Nonomuraea sp. NPDC003560 TaxID=3364341 RepID=UPI0036C660E2
MRNMFAARGVRRALALILLSVSTVLTISVASSPAYAWNPANDGWYKCLIDGKWMWCKDL